MTADLKPCPFCGEKVEMHDYTNAFVAAWVMIHRCQVVGVIHLENYSGTRLAEVWNTRAPAVSDTGADSGPGPSTSQAGEAPVSSAPATAWQPIETAPRDGTPVLTYSADAAADPRQGPVGNPGTPILVMAYIVGEWELVDEIGDWHIPQYDPTHWMPLPAPPVDSSAAPSTPVDNKISADPVGKEAL